VLALRVAVRLSRSLLGWFRFGPNPARLVDRSGTLHESDSFNKWLR